VRTIRGEGGFVGALCSPCHAFITRNEGRYSQAYRNAQREWHGLTDEEMSEAYNVKYNIYKEHVEYVDFVLIYRAIEAKLKEKNS
jgi:hypothetical protein